MRLTEDHRSGRPVVLTVPFTLQLKFLFELVFWGTTALPLPSTSAVRMQWQESNRQNHRLQKEHEPEKILIPDPHYNNWIKEEITDVGVFSHHHNDM